MTPRDQAEVALTHARAALRHLLAASAMAEGHGRELVRATGAASVLIAHLADLVDVMDAEARKGDGE